MIRFLYICLLRMHPPYFKQRFGDEMLWIFDQAAGAQAQFKLLLDGLLSIARQWVLRPQFWSQPLAATPSHPAADGVPHFGTLEDTLPRPGALIQGGVLALVVFAAVYWGMTHGGRQFIRGRGTFGSRYASASRTAAYRSALPGASWSETAQAFGDVWTEVKLLIGWSTPKPPAEPTLPATVPAFQLGEWLEAFNSGSQGKLRRLQAESAATLQKDAGKWVEWQSLAGTLEVRKVEASEPDSIVVLAQARDGSWWRLAMQLATLAPARIAQLTAESLGRKAPADPAGAARTMFIIAAQVPEQVLQSYVGTYVTRSPGKQKVSITLEQGRLEMQMAGGPKQVLVPLSETKFLVAEAEGQSVEFLKQGDGGVPQLHMFRGRQGLVATRVEPVDEVIDALMSQFDKSDVLALGEWHGSQQDAELRSRLIHHPDFPKRVHNIVVEFGNSLYQDVLDKYIRGEEVERQTLIKVWRDTTQSTAAGPGPSPLNEKFLDEIREVNRALPHASKIRVLAGDPPVDLTKVKSKDDLLPFLRRRDTYPAELIAGLLRGREKALVIYGAGHIWRKTIPMPPNIATLIDKEFPGRLYTVVRLSGVYPSTEKLERGIPVTARPVFVPLKGSIIGKLDANEFIGRDIPKRLFPSGLGIGGVADACVYTGKQADTTTGVKP